MVVGKTVGLRDNYVEKMRYVSKREKNGGNQLINRPIYNVHYNLCGMIFVWFVGCNNEICHILWDYGARKIYQRAFKWKWFVYCVWVWLKLRNIILFLCLREEKPNYQKWDLIETTLRCSYVIIQTSGIYLCENRFQTRIILQQFDFGSLHFFLFW